MISPEIYSCRSEVATGISRLAEPRGAMNRRNSHCRWEKKRAGIGIFGYIQTGYLRKDELGYTQIFQALCPTVSSSFLFY